MVETALPRSAPASIVIDLIGDLDARLGDIAANALRRLDPDRRVILSLKHLTTVHSDGFTALVTAVKMHVSFGRTISIVSNGAKTQALLAEAKLGAVRRLATRSGRGADGSPPAPRPSREVTACVLGVSVRRGVRHLELIRFGGTVKRHRRRLTF